MLFELANKTENKSPAIIHCMHMCIMSSRDTGYIKYSGENACSF